MSMPSDLDKVNFVRRFYMNSCDTPWVVYFETLWPALGTMALYLLSFGMADVARGYFRPKGRRYTRHGRPLKQRKEWTRRPGSRRFPVNALPEFGEEIGRRLPGANRFGVTGVTDLQRSLWRIDGAFQRFGYYMLLVDALDDFTYNWTSAIVADPRVMCEGIGRAMRTQTTETNLPGGWGATRYDILNYSQAPVGMTNGGVAVGAGSYLIAMSSTVTVFQEQDEQVDVQLGLSTNDDPSDIIAVSSRQRISGGQSASLVLSASVHGPQTFVFRAFTDGGAAASYSDGIATCFQA